jgi:cysteine synthase
MNSGFGLGLLKQLLVKQVDVAVHSAATFGKDTGIARLLPVARDTVDVIGSTLVRR